MARQRERTLQELLRKTRKLTEIRPSCVLEGIARMRGPGVNDALPSEDSESLEVCDICGTQVQEADLQMCSACDQGFHSSCLEPPINASLGVDWLCSDCQGASSCLLPASEASLDSSCGFHEEKAMPYVLDSKGDRQEEMSNEILSGPQDTPCLGSKSMANLEDGMKNTPEQSDVGQAHAMIDPGLPDLEETRKSSLGPAELEEMGKTSLANGESSEQPSVVEYVRRSKRGRPYKPVGGLHPNKRRSIDGSSRQIDRAQQGKSKPSIDEEDELGAKIGKFRVISTIDEKSVRRRPPDWEERKKVDLGQDSESDENDGSVPAQSGEKGRRRINAEDVVACELVDIAAEGKNLEDHKITGVSPKGSVDSISPVGSVHEASKRISDVEQSVLNLEEDAAPAGLSGGSLQPNGLLRDDQGCGDGHALLAASELTPREEKVRELAPREEKVGTEVLGKPRQGQVKAEYPVTRDPPRSLEVLANKPAIRSPDTSFGMKTAEKVHPRPETSGSILMPLGRSNDVYVVNEGGVLDDVSAETPKFRIKVLSEDKLKPDESCPSDEGNDVLRNPVLHVKGGGTGKNLDHVSNAVCKVEDAALDRHTKERASADSGEARPTAFRKDGVEEKGGPSPGETTGETGSAVIPTAVASAASPVRVQSGGDPVGSIDRILKKDVPVGTSRSPEDVDMGLRGVRSASSEHEDDVKVCDICGDTGYEECLTICSVCNEGAEHIYCMQALRQSIPEDGWLCEGCKLKETDGNLKKGDPDGSPKKAEDVPCKEQVPAKPIYPSPKKKQIMKGNTRSRLSALLEKGKGGSPQKVAAKGTLTTLLSTKRPADDAQTAAPLMKKQMRENIGMPSAVANALTPRSLTRENSSKAPDSGKVKFLPPNALASCQVGGGGGRNFTKSSSFAGHSSQSLRPGLNQIAQVASKNRYVPNSGAFSDAALGGASTPTVKQPPAAPRPPSFFASTATPSSAGRGGGSLKSSEPLPSFLIPSRSGSFAATPKGSKEGNATPKGSKEGNSEGTGLQSFGRDTLNVGGNAKGLGASSSGKLAGSAKGLGDSSSGKMATKWIDTPRPATQLIETPRPVISYGRQISLKGDSSTGSQSLDNVGLPGRPLVVPKRSQIMDPAKGLNRLPSFSRLSNQQSSRDEAPRNSEVQAVRGSRQLPKAIDSSDSGTPRATNLPTNSLKLSAEDTPDSHLARSGGQQIEDVSKVLNSSSGGVITGSGQKNIARALKTESLVVEDDKRPSKASIKAASMKQLVVDDIPKGSTVAGKDLKWKDSPETSWPSAKIRRCYTCKEIGHSAQACNNRSAPSTLSLADLCANIGRGPPSTSSPPSTSNPMEAPGGLSSSFLGQKPSDGTSPGEPKSAAKSSVDPDSASQVPDTECTDSLVVPEKSTGLRQGRSAETESGDIPKSTSRQQGRNEETESGEISKSSLEDKGKPLIRTRKCSPSGQPAAIETSGDLPSLSIGKSGGSSDGVPPVPASNSPFGQPDGFPSRDSSAALGAVTGTPRPDCVPKTMQEVSPRLSNEGAQVSVRQMNTVRGPVLPGPSPGPPQGPPSTRTLEQPLPTPLMRQMKGLLPWGGQLASPRPNLGVVSQEAWGRRVGIGAGLGIAVPESPCLWSGGFEVVSAAVPACYDGIQAYSSSFAAPQVRTVTKTLPPKLQLEEVRRMFNVDAWPVQFQRRSPSDKEIALYFFPGTESLPTCEVAYMRLLEHMMACDLVLMGQVEGADLLIFPSHLLPVEFHHWKSKWFLWGVYRARKSNPAIKPGPVDSVQTSASVPCDQPKKVVPNSEPEKAVSPPGTNVRRVVPTSEPEKAVSPGTVVTISVGDGGEADMEIDMIGDTDLDSLTNNAPQKPSALSSPPLPHEPPPVQPPPPDLIAPSPQDGAAVQNTGVMGNASKQCRLDLDLPPGFGPGPLKQQAPPLSGLPDMDHTPSGPSELKPGIFIAPPGFEKPPPGFEGVSTGQTLKLQVHTEDTAGSTTDVDNVELTSSQRAQRRGINVAEQSRPGMSSQRMSPLPAPSPSPKDVRDDSLGSFLLCSQRYSHSRSKSPSRHRDRMKERIGRTSFNGREGGRERGRGSRDSGREGGRGSRDSGRGRESGRDAGHVTEIGQDRERGRHRERGQDRERERERERGRDREQGRDRDQEREREKERRRDRWLYREREKDREKDDSRSYGRDRRKYRDYRHESRDSRERERRGRRYTRSLSQSPSRSRSFSTSRPRLQSLSVSPPKRRYSGKSYSRRRSRSYSDSPDSIQGRSRRKPRSSDGPTGSREESQDGVSFSSGRRGTSDRRFSPRDASEGDPSAKSRLSAFCREGSLRTRDSARKEEEAVRSTELLGNFHSIPFYDIQEEDGAEIRPLERTKEKAILGSVPRYHEFLPAESDDVQMFENDVSDSGANRPLFPCRRPSPHVPERPKSDRAESSTPWESPTVAKRPAYEFFPVKGGNVGDLRNPSMNPNLELVLGERDGMSVQAPEPQPFFVQLVDPTGSSPEPAHRYADSNEPPGVTGEFPLVAGMRVEPARPDVGNLNLSLSVPQYRKEGNVWVKIEDAQALLGDEDVNFALTL